MVDGSGLILLANKALEVLFGYTKEELVGQPVELLIPEQLRGKHEAHRGAYDANPHVRPMGLGMNLQGRRKDGTQFPVEISLSPLSGAAGMVATAFVRDVSARIELEDERNFLSLQLETELERDRIAMDLHDGIMQDIYAAALTLELAAEDLGQEPEVAGAGIDRAIGQLHDVVRDIRTYIFDLRPRQFSGSLGSALLDLLGEFERNTHIRAEADVADGVAVDAVVGNAIYHIAHEGLSNVQKHARAKTVRLRLTVSGDAGRLSLEDDGRGFDPSRAIPEQHRGLRNMAARAHSVGAAFTVDAAPGRGTRLTVDFALAVPPEAPGDAQS